MGLSAIWKKIARQEAVIARGEAECNFGLLQVNCTQTHVVM